MKPDAVCQPSDRRVFCDQKLQQAKEIPYSMRKMSIYPSEGGLQQEKWILQSEKCILKVRKCILHQEKRTLRQRKRILKTEKPIPHQKNGYFSRKSAYLR